MSVKEKLFGGPQNPQQPKISDDIVNPSYTIAPDGSVSSGFTPSAAPSPFLQSLQQNNPQQNIPQQPAPQPPEENYPRMNNEDRFDIQQPDQPNGYYTPADNSGAAPAADSWECPCGQTGNTGKFCMSCGQPKPQPAPQPEPAAEAAPVPDSWDCPCGQTGNTGNFCLKCGQPKLQPAPQPEPAAETVPVETTIPVEAAPAQSAEWNCECGQTGNTGSFCLNCGQQRPGMSFSAPVQQETPLPMYESPGHLESTLQPGFDNGSGNA